jgi:enoyl-CoA hydratase/carnithine racemase
MIDVFDRLFLSMAELEKPIIGVINGAALGGGYEVVLFCDMVVASEKAKFGQPEIKVGVLPPIACYALPRLLSWPRAMEVLLSGDIFTAAEAKEMGLINQVFPVDEFDQGVDKFLQRFTSLSPVVLALTKKSGPGRRKEELCRRPESHRPHLSPRAHADQRRPRRPTILYGKASPGMERGITANQQKTGKPDILALITPPTCT